MKLYHVVEVGYEYNDDYFYTGYAEFKSVHRSFKTEEEAQNHLDGLEFEEWKNSFTSRYGTPLDFLGEEGPCEHTVELINKKYPHIQLKSRYPYMKECPKDEDLKILIEYFGPLFYKIITSELGN